MTLRRDLVHAPATPCLMFSHGSSVKQLPLNRPVTTLGRAPGCDLCLDAVGVLPVQCIVVRTPEGFVLRNCGIRNSLRLNGEPTEDALLHDSDIIQFGTFAFEVRLPAPTAPPAGLAARSALAQEVMQHLKQSRARLARRALDYRRRLRQRGGIPAPAGEQLAQLRAELERETIALRNRERECDQVARQLEEAERQVDADRRKLQQQQRELDQLTRQASAERQTLEKQRQILEARIQAFDQEAARKKEQLEAEMKSRWQEFQRRLQELEKNERARSAAEERERQLQKTPGTRGRAVRPASESEQERQLQMTPGRRPRQSAASAEAEARLQTTPGGPRKSSGAVPIPKMPAQPAADSPPPTPSERRLESRRRGNPVSVHICQVGPVPETFEGWVIDRSQGGVCLLVDDPQPVGSRLKIRPAKDADAHRWIEIEVKSCRRDRTNFKLGCQFLEQLSWNDLRAFG